MIYNLKCHFSSTGPFSLEDYNIIRYDTVGDALSVALVGELIPNIEEVIKDKLCYSYLLDKLILVTINICAFLDYNISIHMIQ